MVFDSHRGYSVMFGGEDTTSFYAETWLYEYSLAGGTWISGPSPALPSFGITQMMTYDSTNGVSVLFGGSVVSYVWGGTFELNHTYLTPGDYTTDTFDVGYPVANWGDLNWTGEEPVGTDIKFQIATNNDGVTWNYRGPTGPGDYYDASSGTPVPIAAAHNGDRYIKVKAFFETSDISFSPKLDNINITYNVAPNDPTLILPIGSAIVYTDTPRFNWTFNDPDPADIQDAFQVLVDDDPLLGSPTCDSGTVVSSFEYWDYTGCPVLSDGTYYWSVRTRDADGQWSSYPTSQEFVVNTSPTDLQVRVPMEPDTSGTTALTCSETMSL
jgi:hypothetical protein